MDYTSVGPERHPREGARDIAKRWRWAAAQWREGKQTPDWTIGSLENERDLAQQLSSRADLLLSWVEDDALWPD
jgi:hypothetical protein